MIDVSQLDRIVIDMASRTPELLIDGQLAWPQETRRILFRFVAGPDLAMSSRRFEEGKMVCLGTRTGSNPCGFCPRHRCLVRRPRVVIQGKASPEVYVLTQGASHYHQVMCSQADCIPCLIG